VKEAGRASERVKSVTGGAAEEIKGAAKGPSR
jgi:hypothetical protein